MACSLSKHLAILSLVLLINFHFIQTAFSIHTNTEQQLDDQEQEEEDYVLDAPLPNFRPRSRFLATVIKKGTRCDAVKNNVCNGIKANKGTGLLYCCKKHCRNVMGDKNNCGQCGHKCKFGERCCDGKCMDVLSNTSHCGKCTQKCASRVRCEAGTCGYA